ncbi:MAG TPA: 4-hydroxy-tetrahydrodipicolinate synthase [Saprospiraceae bacterium]|nr:4-hydroxy-tetrahydrodipicolinate synthase [Saprospiraceae bacterium]
MADLQFLKGTGVALVTPFDRNGKIDYQALGRIIEHTITGGVEYLVTLGTTGESVTLSQEEKNQVVRFTVQEVAARVPVVIGIGGNNTAELLAEMKALDISGLSAILSSSPAYNKPSQEGIFRHYMALAEQSPLPIIIYNVPGRTSSNLTADTTLRLAHASPIFCGIKEASGDLVQASKIIKHKPPHFQVISGDDPLALGLVAIGGDGVISVIANAYPRQFSDLIRSALAGNYTTAAKINLKLIDVHQWLYVDGNPAGIKAALHYLGLCDNYLRLPLVPISSTSNSKLISELQKLNA